MTYQDIENANAGIKALNLKGKDYAEVSQRVTAFRKLFPDGFILTDIISNDGDVVLMQAKAGYYKEDMTPVVLGSGFAREEKGKGMVNGTSHIENCETSAVGRALGFLGLGINGGGICSAEELVNAVVAQGQTAKQKQQKKPEPKPAPEQKTVQEDPVKAFLVTANKALRESRGISAAENNKLFTTQFEALKAAGIVPDKKLGEYTMDEAESLVNAMQAYFDPLGTEIKND